jgi:hypothetical protein
MDDLKVGDTVYSWERWVYGDKRFTLAAHTVLGVGKQRISVKRSKVWSARGTESDGRLSYDDTTYYRSQAEAIESKLIDLQRSLDYALSTVGQKKDDLAFFERKHGGKGDA